MLKIVSVVGARPNFIKIGPFIKAIKKYNSLQPGSVENILVHTGQHYDQSMSESFFTELNIPEPDINLGVGSGTHAEQVGNTMIAFEKVLRKYQPDWVVVVGDVNATLACSVTAKKEHIRCCHIEAGLRSGDMDMPEEINRIVTDRLSDLLLTPDKIAVENLKNEGRSGNSVCFVGNIMIDSLEEYRKKALTIERSNIIAGNLISGTSLDLVDEQYCLITLHRPSNVDNRDKLSEIAAFLLNEVSDKYTLVWPVHPRCEKNLKEFGLWDKIITRKNLIILKPISYLEMLRLNMDAKMILTDSGGLQEECTVLGTPCVTLRWNTERPVTLTEYGGVSILVGNDINNIRNGYQMALEMKRRPFSPELWDGHTAERALHEIMTFGK